ncbi:MAG: DUF402 domain-containing protein [Actinobacteria bacterium]|nr:DUF402 domain-containing protein [Actinomycetota bacterium]
MPSRYWKPGEVVVWRETWRGRTYFAWPVRVVEDSPQQIAVYIAEGTGYTFPPGAWPFGPEHPWVGRSGWVGHGVLVRHRPGAAHAIWHFWEEEDRRFACWYVNLQAPFARDGSGFDTHDHELDIVVTPDGTWEWKDEEKMDDWVRRGRYTRDEVVEIRAEGERVLAEWPFPTGWEEWTPDPAWPVPEMPNGWLQ